MVIPTLAAPPSPTARWPKGIANVRTVAVMNELGLSLRAEKNAFNQGWVIAARHSIEKEKARLKNAGERPRGGIHESAMEKVAANQGLELETLKKRLQNRKTQASRRKQKK